MKLTAWIAGAAVALVLSPVAALAGDAPEMMQDNAMYGVTDGGHDWSGFYVGALGEYTFACESSGGILCEGVVGISKVFGYNWVDGDIIYGIDKSITFTNLDGYPKYSFQAMGRIGTEIVDNVMIYGGAGLGVTSFPEASYTTGYAALASGVEAALGENLVWRTHFQWSVPFDPDIRDDLSDPEVWGIFTVASGLVWYLN